MKLNVITTPTAKFACPRTCTPGDLCRFMPILAAIGNTRVMSHTVTVDICIKDKGPLEAAVKAMGGKILGDGSHKIEYRTSTGFGFTLANWEHPLVLTADGKLQFSGDDQYYHKSDIDALTGHYAIEAARQAAEAQGWTCYDQDGSLYISHPNGGNIMVNSKGEVDGVGFIGNACNVMSVIEDAIGTPGDRAFKPEYYEHGGLRV